MIELTITDVRVLPGDGGFLIDDGQTSILYDTGFAFTGFQMADKIQKLLGTRPLDYIFLTHSHYDHALGSAYIARRYPKAQVVASSYTATIFSKPSARAAMRQLDRKVAETYGISDYEDLIDDLKVDITVEDGDRLTCGAMCFSVLSLPGHTKCSVGFYLAENKLLLSTETLGVYFGKGTFLPSYLVGYEMALASFQKAKALEIESILLPHYGPVYAEEARHCLERGEQNSIEIASAIKTMLEAGRTRQEVLSLFKERYYQPHVTPVYPPDAFELNTGIMIGLIEKELLKN